MTQKLAVLSLLFFVAAQAFALPTTDKKISENGGAFKYSVDTAVSGPFNNDVLTWGLSKCTVLLLQSYNEAKKLLSQFAISSRGIFTAVTECVNCLRFEDESNMSYCLEGVIYNLREALKGPTAKMEQHGLTLKNHLEDLPYCLIQN